MSIFTSRALGYVACALVLSACSKPIPSPTEQQLRDQFAIDLPAYWRPKSFHVEAAQRGGPEGSPTYRGRFRAVIELASSTYTESAREGDLLFVRLPGEVGEKRTVYGRVQSSWKNGGWQTTLALDNDPTRDVGVPRDFIQAERVIVAGSAEEQAYRDQQRREQEELFKAVEAQAADERERFLNSLSGEWHGSAFTEADSRLTIHRSGEWMSAVLVHQGFREELTVEILAGNRILLTGYNVVRLDGRSARSYNLDTFEVELTADGSMLYGSARDRGGQSGHFSMRKVGG